MNNKFVISVILIIAVLGALPAGVIAEVTGKIFGTVTDMTTGEALPGANIVVVGTQYGAASDNEGNFVIDNVPAGVYSVRATVIGYTPVIHNEAVVSPVKPHRIDFKLNATVIEFGEITVKPNYFEEASDRPVSARSQSNEEIRRLPGGLEDVVRAISILPGVAQVQAGRNDLIVRGGAPSENLYVVDGIEVPNINHFGTQGASGGPLSYINLDYVENTTFSTGGFGVRYGDKLSSVLTLELREGRQDRIGGKGTISASQFGFNLEGPVNNNGSFVFSARRSYLDFIFKVAGFGFVPEYWDFLAKINYKLGPNDQLKIIGLSAIDRTRFFNDTPEKRYNNSRILGNSQDQFTGGMTWRHIFGKGFMDVTLGQTLVHYDFLQADSLQQPIFKNNSTEGETILTNNFVYYISPACELTVGAQAKSVYLRSDMYLPSFTDDFGQQYSLSANNNNNSWKAAGWVQLARNFNRLKIIAGSRIDYFNMIDNKTAFSPRLAAEYSLSSLTTLHASAGRYSQAPSFVWILANDVNRALHYVTVNQYIAGIEHLLREDTKVSIEGYYKEYLDYPASLSRRYLVMANTGAGFGGSEEGFASFGIDPLISGGSGKTRGIEFFVQKRNSGFPLFGTFSISYNKSTYTALDGIERPGSFDQRWIVNLGGGYIFNKEWEVGLKYRYASGRPYTPYNSDYSKTDYLYNTARAKNNYIADFRVDRKWFLESMILITFIDVQNVLNNKIYDIPRYNAFKGKLEDAGGIGILPSLGISVEF
ncbi:MAG TPA: TonB-dependent receptor [bacterium]|nr:TonB-dependent receptor [bacterium]HPN44654.1 TonB-dependent receptor [bacterium]